MFSPAAMLHFSLLVLEAQHRDVLRELGHLGAVELRQAAPTEAEGLVAPAPDSASSIAGCDRLLQRIAELRRSLGPASGGASPPLQSISTFPELEQNLQRLERQTADLLGARQRLDKDREELVTLMGQLSGYEGLDLPLDGSDHFSFLHFVTGTVPESRLKEVLAADVPGTILLPAGHQPGRQFVLAMTTHSGSGELDRRLREFGFEHVPVPVVTGATADDVLSRSLENREEIERKTKETDEQLARFASETRPLLALMESWVTTERALLEATDLCSSTARVVMITGWVPADRLPAVEVAVRRITLGRCLVKTTVPDPSAIEQPPVLLRHSAWVRPLERLMTAYGLPGYRDLEPTLLFGITYLLMFGFMFGDVGHGTVLALSGLLLCRFGRAIRIHEAGRLVLLAGASSILFGFVYGSCFGLPAFKPAAWWHDPLDVDPVRLMGMAIGFGAVLISLGVVLNVVNCFRSHDWVGAVLGRCGLGGLVFYWGAIAILLLDRLERSPGQTKALVACLLGLPLVAWVVAEILQEKRHAPRTLSGAGPGSLPTLVAQAIVGAFEGVLGYFANTISFVRLAAYAMSHAAVLVATFSLAGEVRHLAAGGLLAAGVILAGNLVAIVLEGTIASVQALRLEYYEFFSKFFSGQGAPFRPFQLPPLSCGLRPLHQTHR